MSLSKPLRCNLTELPTNKTLHGRSKYRPSNVKGHNVVIGWNIAMDRDAIDWNINSGVPVYASHSGKVEIRDAKGILSCVIITGTGDDKRYRSVYAHMHIHDSIKNGAIVEKDTLIGYVGKLLKVPHLHYELWIDGQGVCAKSSTELSKKLAKLFD
jgi:murein DD-endopeptidase MepM/ murein hydrolase activator NlpD